MCLPPLGKIYELQFTIVRTTSHCLFSMACVTHVHTLKVGALPNQHFTKYVLSRSCCHMALSNIYMLTTPTFISLWTSPLNYTLSYLSAYSVYKHLKPIMFKTELLLPVFTSSENDYSILPGSWPKPRASPLLRCSFCPPSSPSATLVTSTFRNMQKLTFFL